MAVSRRSTIRVGAKASRDYIGRAVEHSAPVFQGLGHHNEQAHADLLATPPV